MTIITQPGVTRSPIKWAGGKALLSKTILSHFDLHDHGELAEPFIGGGGFFLNSNFDRYYLNDSNHILINLYLCIQNNAERFINDVKIFFNTFHNQHHVYKHLRREYNSTNDIYEKTCLFFYLNRHCFNGLYRETTKGKFDVPFGRYDKVYFPEKEIYNFAEKSQKAKFYCMDYLDFLSQFKDKTNLAIYADPPYTKISDTSDFSSYQAKGFSDNDHLKLIQVAQDLSKKNTVIISNHAIDKTIAWYKDANAELIFFDVTRSISSKTNDRKKARELLAKFSAETSNV